MSNIRTIEFEIVVGIRHMVRKNTAGQNLYISDISIARIDCVLEIKMPIDYNIYPPHWLSVIRPRILERAKSKCEFCKAENYKPHPVTGSKVILTIAHLDHDPKNWNIKDNRLKALCQRCHLAYDRKPREDDYVQLELNYVGT